MCKIICDCGEVLTDSEDGVNGTDYFVCSKCGNAYNVGYSIDEDFEEEEE